MSLAYFDLVGGASGDMTLGALVDAGLPFEALESGLAGLSVRGFRLVRSAAERSGIRGTHIEVEIEPGPQPHRHLRHIEEILAGSKLSDGVRDRALRVFRRLAQAEAHVHGTTVEKVHFHEVGAVDAIVDVTGACLGLEALGVSEVRFSPPPLGRGFVVAAHGRIPLPAPATMQLLVDTPFDMVETEGETVTPTGAALMVTLGRCAPLPPGSVLRSIGYGVGTKTFPDRPNVLRLVLADAARGATAGEVSVLTAHVDDMSGEALAYLMERLFAAGALDVAFAPLVMKKGRPGTAITAIAPPALEEPIASELLLHSSSLGLRLRRESRRELPRSVERVETPFGAVRVKRVQVGEEIRVTPEYEDCAQLARALGRPLSEIYEAARAAAR